MAHDSQNSALSLEHQRLMELVEAEDAANGEVGCGRDWGSKLPVYLQTCQVNISDAAFQELLRKHLEHRMVDSDFDHIVNRVRLFIEPIVVNAHIQGSSVAVQPVPIDAVVEQIPSQELHERFKADLGAVCSDAELEKIVAFTHQVIHQAALKSRLGLASTAQH